MTTQQYIETIKTRFKSGISSEHSYRGDLETLIRNLVTGINITNEPANVTDCGNPDYVITKGKIPIGYIEAKDVGKNLNGKNYHEQFNRYKKALDNLIITDYIWFQFFQHGELVNEIRIAEIDGNSIVPLTDNIEKFENLIQNFCTFISQTIKSPKKLAEMMAAKARLLENILEAAITSDEETRDNTSLKNQYDTFKKILIHNLKPKEFADIYAQTLAYGMFAARLNDTSLDDFSRQEAAELIPKSNPFLRKLFQYIAGYDIDERIVSTVNNLADVFRATNVEAMLQNFGRSTHTEDPIIHFYETFLAEYDPKLRKSRGVWYTPQPVVNFIVRAVDDILKTEFELTHGLADVSKTQIKVEVQGKKAVQEFHRVQILDPATGTGTFLAETIRQIYKKFEGQQGVWSNYVETHLLPRLNGFELLMASYAMAHLKLDLLLSETGYKSNSNQRFKVFLTNSLEEYHPDTGTLFANWLSAEASEANNIKKDTPVMCVIGNPPYSGISSNNGEWISNLIDDYKYVDGVHFNERKHWLNDDYVKFLRYGQHYIEKNGSGVLAFINPHGFLDNPTFRGMRWHLLKTYDKIYTIDLHGNSKKKETAPDGSADVNVFDIQQGVSINIFIKTGNKKPNALGKVYHHDLFGKRDGKYKFLSDKTLSEVEFKEINYSKPYYFFVPKDEEGRKQYEKGFRVDELFPVSVTGIVTARDSVVIDISKKNLLERMEKFTDESFSDDEIRKFLFPNKKEGKYLAGDSRGWKLVEARKNIKDNNHESLIKEIDYRPFDTRSIYYSSDMVDWGREQYMKHLIDKDNISLISARQSTDEYWSNIQISKNMIDNRFHFSYKGIPSQFPLYIYADSDDEQKSIDKAIHRKPNFCESIISKFSDALGLEFKEEVEQTKKTFAPIDVLDYIYAILHSPTFRKTYNEFLKVEFPRIPFPVDEEIFWRLVEYGGKLRQIHLMESDVSEKFVTQYPVDGDNIVRSITVMPGPDPHKSADTLRAYINDTQYFDGIPAVAWNFYIGGYQPAQKWLKDRKNRELDFEDILHYQKIIVALTETDRIMKEIDKIDFL
jgi:predicted helicase